MTSLILLFVFVFVALIKVDLELTVTVLLKQIVDLDAERSIEILLAEIHGGRTGNAAFCFF